MLSKGKYVKVSDNKPNGTWEIVWQREFRIPKEVQEIAYKIPQYPTSVCYYYNGRIYTAST